MIKNGILALQSSRIELGKFFQLLKTCANYIHNVLYVDFNFNGEDGSVSREEMCDVLERIYKSRAREVTSLDIRVLLGNHEKRQSFSHRVDVAFLDSFYKNEPSIVEKTFKKYNFKRKDVSMHFLDGIHDAETLEYCDCNKVRSHETVAVGGTFDRIHNGHRLLLSASCLLANSKVIVGVSDESLLVDKTLAELIAPLHVRMKNVAEFMEDIKPGLIKEIVPLSDPAGPTMTDPGIECLVVSEETVNGGHAVNKLRKDSGLDEMELFLVQLVCGDESHEVKLSSTARRQEELGVLLRPPKQLANQSDVYVIGLTGGIASGKSSIAKRLEKLGAGIISADVIGHSVYEQGTDAYHEVLESFGHSILNSNGSINRRRLGSIVFNDHAKLRTLNKIVWPRIMQKIKDLIAESATKGVQVVVVEAALLLEAGWDEVVNEVWVSIIPEVEAVKRLRDRNGLVEEEARKRISSQLKNKERVSQANVVLSTLWEPEYTQKQVEKAWSALQARITR